MAGLLTEAGEQLVCWIYTVHKHTWVNVDVRKHTHAPTIIRVCELGFAESMRTGDTRFLRLTDAGRQLAKKRRVPPHRSLADEAASAIRMASTRARQR